MKYSIRTNWAKTFELLLTHKTLLAPFFVFALIEGLVLEVLFFANRKPLAHVVVPLVKKFFGEGFSHYAGYLIILPRLFEYCQIVIYILFGAWLTAVALQMLKSVKLGVAVRMDSVTRQALTRYGACVAYGILIYFLLIVSQKLDLIVLSKVFNRLSAAMPQTVQAVYPFVTSLWIFCTNVFIQMFLAAILPLVIFRKLGFGRALSNSVFIGGRYFFTMVGLVVLPALLYIPIIILKTFSFRLVMTLFPEVNVLITAAGILVSLFIDCFVSLSVGLFVFEIDRLYIKR